MQPLGSTVAMLGRDTDSALLRAAYDDPSLDGVVVVGPMGVGKTRLVSEFLSEMEEGSGVAPVRVVATRGLSSVPLGAFADHLGALDASGTTDVALLVSSLVHSAGVPMEDARLLVAVDDLQLLDEVSMSVLQLLTARDDTFLVATLRAGEMLSEEAARFAMGPRTLRHDLAPLMESDAVALAERLIGGPLTSATAVDLWRLTAGNPLFVHELIRGGLSSGVLALDDNRRWDASSPLSDSPRVLETIGRRLLALSDAAKDVCCAVAMCDPVPLEVLVEVVPGVAVEALEEQGLLRTRSQRGGQPTVGFAHPIYGELAASGALPGFAARRSRMLRPLANSMSAVDGADVLIRCAELVASALQAEPGDSEILTRAAFLARSHMDLVGARRFANAAFDRGAGDNLGLACLLADCETVLDSDDSRFAALFEEAADPAAMATITAAHVHSLVLAADRPTSGLALLAQRLDLPELRGNRFLVGLHASMLFFFENSAVALEIAQHNISDGVDPEDPATIAVLAAGACAALVEGLPELSGQWSSEGLSLCDNLDPEIRGQEMIHARDQLITCHYLYGVQVGEMVDDPDAVLEEYADRGPTDPLDALMVPGFVALWRGHLDRAHQLFEQGREMLEMTALNRRTFSYTNRAWLSFLRGDVDDGWTWVERQRDVPGAIAGFAWMPARAEVLGLLAEGRAADAVLLARRAAGDPNCGAWGRTTLLHDVVRAGRTTSDDVARLDTLAERESATWFDRTCRRHASAQLADDAEALESVAASFESAGLDLYAAEALAQATIAYRAADDPAGAQRSAVSARRLLETVGSARTPALEVFDASFDVLTDRERTVARLAAEGLSNKQIAGRLIVSVRTVANQLQAVYSKLDIHSRAELPAVMCPPTPEVNRPDRTA